jgi:alkylhydroperoxidase family enzyme
MRFLKRFVGLFRVLVSAKRNRMDLARWLGRRPPFLGATLVGEVALLTQNRVDNRLKVLAEMKAAALVSCEYCLDIGAALAKAEGLTPQHVTDLPRFEESDVYTELEVLVLRLATRMSETPAIVPEDLRDALVQRLGKAGYAELTFTIAWEHKRSRLNQALGVRPSGFGDGLTCPIPEGATAAAASR